MSGDDLKLCFHCGDPLPAEPVRAASSDQCFCCWGCLAAAEFIRDSGLGDYYRLRSQRGARVQTESLAHWDRQDVLDTHSLAVDADHREISLISDDMHCAACAWLIDRALRREPGVQEVVANAISGRIRLRWNQRQQPLSQLLQRLSGLGYRVSLGPDPGREAAAVKARRMLIIRLGVAALGTMQAMMLAEALYLDFDQSMNPATRDFFRWITWMVSTPVVFFSGWPFLRGAWREVRLGRLGMDFLVSGAVLIAWLASSVETLRGGPHVWFDAAVMFVFFLLAARSLEHLARQRANALVERLAQAQPALATRIARDGARETLPITGLRIGDEVEVRAGDALPADGRLLDNAALNESLLSGEALPVQRRAGDSVLAGSIAVDRPLRLRIERLGSDTRIAQLLRAVENAQSEKPALAQWADRLAHRFVLGLLLATALTAIIWWQIDPSRALEISLAVLVISCPCALSLAIPTALVSAHAALAQRGLLATGENALQRLAEVDTLLIDKTGTLSCGQPRLQRLDLYQAGDRTWALGIVAALERAAHHPLAQAFVEPIGSEAKYSETKLSQAKVSELRNLPGRGVEGRVDGQRYRFGRADFSTTDQADDGALWLGDESGRPLARFELDDPLRSEARMAIDALRGAGLQLSIVSGDSQQRVAAVAEALGIDRFRARMSPEDKLTELRALQAKGHRVWMVGDGINDAPVLAGADVALAMGRGAPLAHRSADWVLQHGNLLRLPEALQIARKTRRIMRQNLGWALAYNLVALPFAMAGWIAPWLAAIGMTASSLAVTLNALRLARPSAPVHRAAKQQTETIAPGADPAVDSQSLPLAGGQIGV